MKNSLDDLYSLKKSDLKKAVNAATQAYYEADDEPFLIPDPSKRFKHIKVLMKITLRHSLKFGKVYSPSPRIEGFAAWLPYDKTKIPLWRYIRYGALKILFYAGLKVIKTMSKYDSYCKNKHLEHANFPHWYLYNLAIEPRYQGQGLGSKLLSPMLKCLDEQNLPCYLETDEKNISLYQHFGFEVVDRGSLEDFDTEMIFMLRIPSGNF